MGEYQSLSLSSLSFEWSPSARTPEKKLKDSVVFVFLSKGSDRLIWVGCSPLLLASSIYLGVGGVEDGAPPWGSKSERH